ncbi:hypothetical protein [Paenibacillus medicaginis]|uniref:ABC transporter substrate-binding protein n=1 Tax=Paenibacillus medicaginis TaxID=1470560 RepID=A0ABV5C528_9BACL
MRVMVTSALYSRIFGVRQPHPDIYVDYNIWNKINMELPPGYTVPDPRILAVLVGKA